MLADLIRKKTGAEPIKYGLILGSGLGHIADQVDGVAIDYADLPGFPYAGVSGHNPKLVVGNLEGVRVAVLGGRMHYYERGQADVMRVPIETLHQLGAEAIIATNAAGTCEPNTRPGDIMMLDDHINFAGANPLIGEDTDQRFVSLSDAYDPEMRAGLRAAAQAANVEMSSGVYAWFSGPSFETPAEIRAIRRMGADAVGMSTVPEVILARFFGMKAAAISVITNMAAGLSSENLSHEHTKKMAPIGAKKLEKVLRQYLLQQSG
ncbi:MAG: purine-nucleoside phosphorylase [Rhodobacteraceae bacterium]|nr:purine-nucleoside phosphorylase [Paracoccaceae bacterium]